DRTDAGGRDEPVIGERGAVSGVEEPVAEEGFRRGHRVPAVYPPVGAPLLDGNASRVPLLAAPSAHDVEISRGVVQPAATGVRHRDDVLDPYAEPARQVDARFDAEAHTWYERSGLTLHKVRWLVRRDPDAVADPVDEVLPVSGVRDDPTGDPVDLLALD